MRTEIVQPRQIAWMILIILIGGSLTLIPKELALIAKHNSWISYLLPTIYALVIIQIFIFLMKRYPGKNLFEISRESAGKWGGGLINALLIFQFTWLIVRDVMGLCIFIRSTLLAKTPMEIIVLIFVVVMIYYGGLMIENQVRVIDMMFPIFFMLVIILPLLLAGQFTQTRLEPFLLGSVTDMTKANILQAGWYGDILILGAVLHTFSNVRTAAAAMRYGVFLSTWMLTFIIMLMLMVMGDDITALLMFPIFTMVEQSQLTDFMDRLEIFVFSIWIPVTVMKVILVYTAFLYGLSSYTKSREFKSINKPAGLVLLMICLYSFQREEDIFAFGIYAAIANSLLLSFPLLILLVLLSVRKKAKNAPARQSRNKIKSRWQRWDFFLLMTAFLFILSGILAARKFPLIATSCTVGYLICLLLTVIVSFLYLRETNNRLKGPG